MTAEPLAVAARFTSTHSEGNCTLLMVPLALNTHCWWVVPLQSQICARVPAVVVGGRSRHLPRIRSVAPTWVNCWLAPLWQSQMIIGVPLAEEPWLTSRHRPEASPRSRNVVGTEA